MYASTSPGASRSAPGNPSSASLLSLPLVETSGLAKRTGGWRRTARTALQALRASDKLDVVLIETPQEDRDFDLDVRLQPVQHPISAPTTKIDCGTFAGCPTGASACQDYRRQD